MSDKLLAVIRALNKIEVRGEDNLDILLGCIMTLKRMQAELEKSEVSANGN